MIKNEKEQTMQTQFIHPPRPHLSIHYIYPSTHPNTTPLRILTHPNIHPPIQVSYTPNQYLIHRDILDRQSSSHRCTLGLDYYHRIHSDLPAYHLLSPHLKRNKF